MANVVVVGSQWGDEGKGKIVDWLSEQADIVVRFQGGHNAGHTLVIDGDTYKLSLFVDFALTGVTLTDPSQPVPEPGTWGMMLAGLGVVGAAMQRRKPTEA